MQTKGQVPKTTVPAVPLSRRWWLLVAVLVALGAYYVWPTPWLHPSPDVRIGRWSGIREEATAKGWQPQDREDITGE